MSAKTNGQRIFILVIVVVFFLTSLATTGFVLIDSLTNKDSQNNSTDVQKQLEEQQKAQKKEGALEGTKLANFTPVAKVDSLQKIDLVPGNGAEVKEGGSVVAHYTGALAKDGTIFESSKDMGQPVPFSLGGVIQGWQQGVPGMKAGGTRRLVIPASLAYGAQGNEKIPANSDLVFDIELVEVK